MSATLAPTRPVLRTILSGAIRQQCRRCLSQTTTASALSTRPSIATSRLLTTTRELQARHSSGGSGGSGGSSGGSGVHKTVEQAKSRYRSGPFSWKAGVLFIATAGGLMWYFEHEKERMQRKRIADATKGVGKPKVGGPFELIDNKGKRFTSEDMKGRYALVYFGFSHCPDICPDELDKMARMFDMVEEKRPGALLPIFVTCDPQRDTPEVLTTYLDEFHPKFIGLTGTYDDIKDMCKKYRVYFSTPRDVKPGQDYLVDHSIYFYLMDPDGDFVEALGRQHSPTAGAKLITDHMNDWSGAWKKKDE